jgi:MFS family permease
VTNAAQGTVVGMLAFGYLSDKVGRKFGMVNKFRLQSGNLVTRIA